MQSTQSIGFLTFCLMIGTLGCGSILKRPDPEWIRDLDTATTLVLRQRNSEPINITDPATLQRIGDIYADSKWTPYWHTLPATLGDQTIEIYNDSTLLRTFCVVGGVLWESGSYTKNRTAPLREEDRMWLESLFASNSNRNR